MGIVSALALRIWRTNENARVAGKTLCFRLRVCFAREAALRMPVHHSCTPRLVRGPPLTSRLSVTMASITASSVAVRAVVGRKSFLAGNARVAAAAPKTVNKARFTVRAADEVRDCFYRVTYGVPGRARAIHARCAMPPKRAFGERRDTPTAIAVARVVRRSSARRGTATEPKAMREKHPRVFFRFLRTRARRTDRGPCPRDPRRDRGAPRVTHHTDLPETRVADRSRVPSPPRTVVGRRARRGGEGCRQGCPPLQG